MLAPPRDRAIGGGASQDSSMEPGHWPSEHSDALRDYFLKGMSYAEIGRQINARFGTAYTRNAVVGRAKRLGLIAPVRTTSPSIVPVLPSGACFLPHRPALLNLPPKSAMRPAAPVKLRCVGVQPRLVRWSNSPARTVAIPMAATRTGRRLPSAAIRASRARAIARRMRASRAAPEPAPRASPAPSC
ncbi:GcrA cell cycle regulator [Bradyrhizobium sp. F1.13.3]